MGFVGRACPDCPMKLDGIGMGQKIPPDPSRAEWVDKTYKTDCDEKGLFHSAAVVDQRRLQIFDVVCAVLTHEDIMQHLLLLLEVVQLVCSFWTSGLDEVSAEAQRIAGLSHVEYLSFVHSCCLYIASIYHQQGQLRRTSAWVIDTRLLQCFALILSFDMHPGSFLF